MGVVPNTRIGKLEFYEAHLSTWAAQAANIGLTAAQDRVTDHTQWAL